MLSGCKRSMSDPLRHQYRASAHAEAALQPSYPNKSLGFFFSLPRAV